ncbi:MAG TPA: Calx-beta domain-containing protein [Pyrinomonadaceae bacterium]|nr:Calx-beta domain-containing protein [Pyrinomonadaceae bacterium]
MLLVAVSPAAVRAQGSTVNLADYGAVGDNVADDGPALQHALNALAQAGGGTLVVPQGRYAIVTPVVKDFTGLASSISILGVPSSTVVNHRGTGTEKTTGLGLTSEFYPKTGETQDALTLTGLDTLLIKDIAFVGTLGVTTDAKNTLVMRRIGEATVRHCEFYALSSRVRDGSIITAWESKFKLDQSKILGCTGSTAAATPIIHNHLWKGIEVTDTVFVDYGQRPNLYGKMTVSPQAWLAINSPAPLTSNSPRREVVLRNVFMDEGGWMGVLSNPLSSDTNRAKTDLIYIHDMIENVGHFATFGLNLTEIEGLLVEQSRYKWSRNASAAVYTQQVGTAILDRIECVDHADRILATSQTGRLYVIDSLYTTLDSDAQFTKVITTTNPDEDPVQYVRQRYQSVLGREPDPAGHFYWSNLLLRCADAAQCLKVGRAKLDAYLGSAPAPKFSITGRVTDQSGRGIAGVAVRLDGSTVVSALTDANGNYRFSGLPTSGAYTVTADNPAYNFGPAGWTITTPARDQTAKDFVAGRVTHSAGGKVLLGTEGLANQQVRVTSTNPNFDPRTVETQYDGSYVFEGLPAGDSYTIEFLATSRIDTYTPASHSITNLHADQAGLNFSVTLKFSDISGRVILGSAGLNGVVVKLKDGSGAVIKTVTTATIAGVEGSFKFTGLPAGSPYSVELTESNAYYYTPAVRAIESLDDDVSGQNFSAKRKLFTISGRVLNPAATAGVGDVTMTLTSPTGGYAPHKFQTSADGSYTFTGVPGGRDYLLTPSKPEYNFKNSSDPSQSARTYTDLGATQTNQNFTATPFPTLSINDKSVTEGDSGTVNATFTVTLAGTVTQPVSVAFAANGVTAGAGSDFNSTSGTLNFTSASSQTITVQVKGDTLDEPNETFQVVLSNPTNATLSDGTAVGTIADNDPFPTLKVSSPTVTEPDTGSNATATFTVSLSAPSWQTVTVKYQTANGSAIAPRDYTATALTTLTFMPGERTKTVTVPVVGDLLDEVNEYFRLVLSAPTNATVEVGKGTCTITDDDPRPTITITNATVTEADSTSVNAYFTIKLSAASGQTVSVQYATANGKATAGSDYTALALTTLTFTPGQTSRTVAVQVKGDTVQEANETFFLNLSGAVNAVLGDAQGLGTINNDD